MEFNTLLQPDTGLALESLGYTNGAMPDAATRQDMQELAGQVAAATRPRWNAVRLPLAAHPLAVAGWALQGKDIQKHLAGCHEAFLLVVTLGQGVDALLRAASAADMRRAVLLDALASTLVEGYADAAQALLHGRLPAGQYMTGRYSPGYGDFPLAGQRELLRLADGPRGAGVTMLGSGLLAPAKSITALLGISHAPVKGHLAGCEGCALNGKCRKQQEGNRCGKQSV